MKSVSSAAEYVDSTGQWKEAMYLLRDIFLSAGLEETIKWGGPVYRYKGKNLGAMAAFKSYAGIWFYQGALLKDEAGKLVNAQEGVTKALRQWRFVSSEQIRIEADLIRTYIFESMANIDQNLEIKPVKSTALEIPDLLSAALEEDKALSGCFDALSLTNRRDYCEYIAQPKQDKTKELRLEKIIPMILRGEGLNDKYKK